MTVDEDQIVLECVEDYCECERVPWWKLILLPWLFFA